MQFPVSLYQVQWEENRAKRLPQGFPRYDSMGRGGAPESNTVFMSELIGGVSS
jgi:hypothetical protein